MYRKTRLLMLVLIASLMLACTISTTAPTSAPASGADATQVAMQVQLTVQAVQQATMAAQLTQQSGQPAVSVGTPAPQQVQPTNPPQPIATPDLEQEMSNARILVYEDTLGIGLWIKDALDNMGLHYTHVNDAVGDFMSNLNSGIQWDLIIVGAEAKTSVQGEFWDVISERINGDNKTALIAEIWYLDLVGEGRIKPVLTQCGIGYQKDWEVADSIYWLIADDPIFNQPNTVLPFLHYSHYWISEAGDLVELLPGSDAKLLAGTHSDSKSDHGLIASCYDGRVIFQTFSNHDYHQDDVILLWENYITNTLKNHFEAIH
jgi:hypothetical protein